MMMRSSTQTKLVAVLLPAMLLSGCLVGPNYQRPKVSAPPVYRGVEGAAQQASIADLPWWEVFKDETLKGLVQTSLTNNYDLRIAVTRIEQARQISLQARAQYFPSVGYNSTISGGKNEFAGSLAPNGGSTRGAFAVALGAAWEADIWGRIRRLNEAARAEYLATEEARRGVLLTLVSDVSQAYFELLGLQLQLEIARQTTRSFDEIVKLFTQRFEGGVSSMLDVSRAAAARAITAATIPEFERQIALKENQISVLLGQNPGAIETKSKLLDQIVPPDVPAGIPSALLERRPDILVAEQQVRSANARIGVATAAFFPQIGLTALLGGASTPLSDFASGKTNAWSAAGNIAGPIYQGGALKARKQQAIAAWEQSRLLYELAALNAFQDVSNALVSRQKYEATRVENMRAVKAYQDSVDLSTKRYVAGKASYFEVLEAQQQLFPAENALAITELNRRVVIVQLYRALGGGWNLQNPAAWSGSAPPAAPPKK
jgi:outer membrane protein, multidrug efflux system